MSDKREKFIEMFSPTSKNFMGTGLTLQEFMQLGMAEKVADAWFRQEQDERHRRFDFLISLCVEFDRIRNVTPFALGLAKGAIEALIDGDWKMVKEWAGHFTFSEEREEVRQRYGELYARFAALLMQVYDTRPGTMGAQA